MAPIVPDPRTPAVPAAAHGPTTAARRTTESRWQCRTAIVFVLSSVPTVTGLSDKQELTWTYDGQVDRIKGQGTGGRTPYMGLADKCIDLRGGLTTPGQPVQLYTCNTTPAQSRRSVVSPGATQTDPDRGTLTVYDNWCAVPAANTAGPALQIQKCDGSAGQQWDAQNDTRHIYGPAGARLLTYQGQAGHPPPGRGRGHRPARRRPGRHP